jgi:hypothetical protein
MPLPDFLERLLAEPPKAGDGVHPWMFRVARHLHAHWPATKIADTLAERLANCGRRVSRKEVEDAVANSIRVAWRPDGSPNAVPAPKPWPDPDPALRARILRETGVGNYPWDVPKEASHAEEIIDALFPKSALLCCGYSKTRFDTKPRDAWRGQLAEQALIVPNVMTSLKGKVQGKDQWSAHTLDNTGVRQFLVVEFDHGALDEQSALIVHLAGFAPLACTVFSGAKSVHGWFYCFGQPEPRVRAFFAYALRLGADDRMWSRCQFARMPDGKRDNGRQQTCLFLNPEACQ